MLTVGDHGLRSHRRTERGLSAVGRWWRSAGSLVDVAAVSELEDEDEQFVVVDLVNDAVVAGPDPPLARAADQAGRGRWPWVVGEQLECGLDPSTDLRVLFAELTGG